MVYCWLQVAPLPAVKFVKASDSHDSSGGGEIRNPGVGKASNIPEKQPVKSSMYPGFVKATSSDTSEINLEKILPKSNPYSMFVKASDSSDEIPVVPSTKSEPLSGFVKAGSSCEAAQKGAVFSAFVKSTSHYQSTDLTKVSSKIDSPKAGPLSLKGKHFKSALNKFSVERCNQQRTELDQTFYELSTHLREITKSMPQGQNTISALHMAVDKVRMAIVTKFVNQPKGTFTCNLEINYIYISKGVSSNKKGAKQSAYERAVSNLKKPYLKVIRLNPEKQELQCSDIDPQELAQQGAATFVPGMTKLGQATESNISTLGKGKKRSYAQLSRPVTEFLIIEPLVKNESFNATSILRQSADFNKMAVTYDFREVDLAPDQIFRVRCCLLLEGQMLADATGLSRTNAKAVVSEKALETLRECCWTIQTKKNEDTEEAGLTRDEIMGEIRKKAEEIPDSNVGNKLLKMMGWTGGGVGKHGDGIVDPVAAAGVINREGLGLQAEKGITSSFLPRIRAQIQEYTRSNKQQDLVFSPEFSKEERAMIHKECQKLGLKTKSHGKADQRYLVAGRKRNASELFDHVMRSGGETSKYTLIPPQCEQL